MKKQLSIYTYILLLTGTVMTSCKKLIEIDAPADQLVTSSVFLDTLTADAAMTGMYSRAANPNPGTDMGTATSMFNSMSADETYCYIYNFYDDFTNNALTPQIYYVDALWGTLYNNIFTANSVIAGLSGSPLPEGYKTRCTAEAKFMRALSYFYLVNEFGAAPLVMSTDVHNTTRQPRDSANVVYDQIEKDLTEANQALPATLDLYGGKRIRATTWAATALLARVYLYRGKWQQAENMATTVINNPGLFHMKEDLSQVFLANNEEGILQFVNGITSSWLANNFVPFPASPTPKFVLKDGLYNSFETGDKRKNNWIGIKTYGGVDYPYPAKYRYMSGVGAVEYMQVLRLSEQYLIRAEARMQQQKFSDAAADINIVRARAGLSQTTATDASSLATAIEKERRTEFFCEWGQRWLDLKRWPGVANPAIKRADEVLSALKGDQWQATDAFYPIPQSQINANLNLHQNPGY
ncbi:RagB/SusD domain-containing protein [Chitinophaga sp. YR627]|uniref:RagB/SusD family nutrient uptake outer membrane protein n=1 Tax=Chitinophaga sp. YR627 TaxID=1881041 RepID=UPI0008F058AF|nr:RagB/SusD family nutrient uptake outer membrane protein [Chitinophaga sp. YR627]SFO60445.1 RagB/SusD domain-containing protein [Chitinophaga sp. YR627]